MRFVANPGGKNNKWIRNKKTGQKELLSFLPYLFVITF